MTSGAHVDDVARAYLLALEHAPAGSVYHVSTSNDTSMRHDGPNMHDDIHAACATEFTGYVICYGRWYSGGLDMSTSASYQEKDAGFKSEVSMTDVPVTGVLLKLWEPILGYLLRASPSRRPWLTRCGRTGWRTCGAITIGSGLTRQRGSCTGQTSVKWTCWTTSALALISLRSARSEACNVVQVRCSFDSARLTCTSY